MQSLTTTNVACFGFFFWLVFFHFSENNSTQGDSDLPQNVLHCATNKTDKQTQKRNFLNKSPGQDPHAACLDPMLCPPPPPWDRYYAGSLGEPIFSPIPVQSSATKARRMSSTNNLGPLAREKISPILDYEGRTTLLKLHSMQPQG